MAALSPASCSILAPAMRDFKRLRVWKDSHDLAISCYRATQRIPQDELFGLRSQLRRAASSIPMNIAEGCGHDSERQFARYLRQAAASANEVEYQLLLLRDLNLLDPSSHRDLHDKTCEVRRMVIASQANTTTPRMTASISWQQPAADSWQPVALPLPSSSPHAQISPRRHPQITQ